jgi:UDP-3-O-acyl-N-acetylglucosamine deacetylase
VSIDEDMSNPTRLTTTYSKNGMKVASREVAIGVTKQMMDKKGLKQEDFPVELPIYMRVHAYIDGVEGSETYSNIVKFNKVKTGFALPDVEMPEQLFVMGDFTENNWEKAVPTIPVNGATSIHWRIAWINGNGVMTSPVMGPANWSDDYITVTYKSKTAGFKIDDNGKITADNEGWYLMVIESKCDNDMRTMELTFSFDKAEVWLIGTSIVNPEAIGKDGTIEQDAPRKFINIDKPIEITDPSGAYVKIESAEEADYDLTIDFGSHVLGVQRAHWDNDVDYISQIAPCRTFCFFHEVEFMLANNLIKGGDIYNAIVVMEKPISDKQLQMMRDKFEMPQLDVTPKGYLNNIKLHFANECGRHKMLDVIGDLRLCGGFLNAKVTAYKSGHTINTAAARAILQAVESK